MLKRIVRNNLRRPAYSLLIVLFAAVMTVVLCWLHKSSVEEQKNFESTYAAVPVAMRVRDLDGSKPLEIAGWIVDLFGEKGLQPNMEPFVGEFYVRVPLGGSYPTDEIIYINGEERRREEYVEVNGIGSLYVAEELTEDWGGKIYWNAGYDETVLASKQEVCLVPEHMKDMETLVLNFTHTVASDFSSTTRKTSHTMQVAGYYEDQGNNDIYCPYRVMELIHAEIGASKRITELCAILNDNNRLAEMREVADRWFARPNATGKQTEWGSYGYKYYLYAMDIEDYMLRTLERDLKSSMQLNTLASLAVFVLSAGAGFLTGFLVIRAKKREIALMRTMGTSHLSIFVQLALEQMLCVLVGIGLGGCIFLWQPLQRLGLFAVIYFAGLSAALLIFLWKNLLTTIKEDE